MMIEKHDLNFFTDLTLWKLARKDNREAFMAIFDRYSPNLYIYVIQIISTRIRGKQLEEDTREIIILVFEDLWASRRKLSENVRLEDYLFTSAYHQAMNYKGLNNRQNYTSSS